MNSQIKAATLNSLVRKLGLVLIQYIVLCDHNPFFMISELSFEVRFRYLRNLESCTLLQSTSLELTVANRKIKEFKASIFQVRRQLSA